eukprot:6488206-Pyramimonas_sp.AAC.1
MQYVLQQLTGRLYLRALTYETKLMLTNYLLDAYVPDALLRGLEHLMGVAVHSGTPPPYRPTLLQGSTVHPDADRLHRPFPFPPDGGTGT